MLREQLWFDFCDDLPIEIEQRIDEGILEAERFKERAEQVRKCRAARHVPPQARSF